MYKDPNDFAANFPLSQLVQEQRQGSSWLAAECLDQQEGHLLSENILQLKETQQQTTEGHELDGGE